MLVKINGIFVSFFALCFVCFESMFICSANTNVSFFLRSSLDSAPSEMKSIFFHLEALVYLHNRSFALYYPQFLFSINTVISTCQTYERRFARLQKSSETFSSAFLCCHSEFAYLNSFHVSFIQHFIFRLTFYLTSLTG